MPIKPASRKSKRWELEIPLEKVGLTDDGSTPGRDPRGWVITISHLVLSSGYSSRSSKLAMITKESPFLMWTLRQRALRMVNGF